MPLPVWPSGLDHRPAMEPLSVQSPYGDAVVTEFEDGPPRMRRQSNTVIQKLAYVVRARSAGEYALWEGFVRQTLGNGVSHFTIPVFLPALGCVPRRCYLDGGKWSAKPNGSGAWLVSFTLCVFSP